MKVKCIGKEVVMEGIFKNAKSWCPGITIGKTYEVTLFLSNQNEFSSAPEFLLYNDSGIWDTYPVELFKPIGSKKK